MQLKQLLIDNLDTVLIIIVLWSVSLLTLYLRERVKNKAKLHDINRLEDEKESIRKEHQLDIEKRKYKYESKKEQFVKYFNLIDDLATESNKQMLRKFLPMIESFNQEYLTGHGNKKKETAAITKFSSSIQTLMFDANRDLIRLRSETNAIKIIAGDRTVALINEMDRLYDESFTLSSEMLKKLVAAVTTNDFTEIKKLEIQINEVAKLILGTKDLMIEQIRTELDEI